MSEKITFEDYQARYILRPSPHWPGEYQAVSREDGLIAADAIPANNPREAFDNRHLAAGGTPEAVGLSAEEMDQAVRP